MKSKEEIRIDEIVEDDSIDLEEMYSIVIDEDLGFIDGVNHRETIEMYINDMVQEGIMVSHMLVALENSNADLFEVWLGNSMETPDPIETKERLREALGLI